MEMIIVKKQIKALLRKCDKLFINGNYDDDGILRDKYCHIEFYKNCKTFEKLCELLPLTNWDFVIEHKSSKVSTPKGNFTSSSIWIDNLENGFFEEFENHYY